MHAHTSVNVDSLHPAILGTAQPPFRNFGHSLPSNVGAPPIMCFSNMEPNLGSLRNKENRGRGNSRRVHYVIFKSRGFLFHLQQRADTLSLYWRQSAIFKCGCDRSEDRVKRLTQTRNSYFHSRFLPPPQFALSPSTTRVITRHVCVWYQFSCPNIEGKGMISFYALFVLCCFLLDARPDD